MPHIGCKHLDYDEEKYPSCKIITIQPGGYKYWKRPSYYEGQPVEVQFCKKSGIRINSVFDCIYSERMSCYEPQ